MAEIFVETQEFSRAKHHIIMARKTDNQHPELLMLAGIINMKSFDRASGEELIQKAMDLDPYLELQQEEILQNITD